MVNQIDSVIEMLSKERASTKLKGLTIKHNPNQERHSLVTLIFEEEDEWERHISIYGEGLSIGFGWISI